MGELLGLLEGAFDGKFIGLSLGLYVGILVGLLVGLSEGEFVGLSGKEGPVVGLYTNFFLKFQTQVFLLIF